MKFIDLIKVNKSLIYFDAETLASKTINDIDFTFFHVEESKSLAFLYLDNSLDAIEIFWSFWDSPHAVVLLNPKLDLLLKKELEENYTPQYIYDSTRHEIHQYDLISFISNKRLFKCKKRYDTVIHPKIKVLLSTSGTTGSPKFVKLSEENIIANAQSISTYLPIENTDTTPLNLSIFYSYGLSVLTSNSLKGGKIVCTNKDVMNKEFWADFEKWGYTSMAGVPFVYEMLNRIGFLKKDYPKLRYMTQAGGKLNSKLVETFGVHLSNQSKAFYVMYGQTEATARMSYLPPQYLTQKLESIGMPIPNGAFEIDKETSELIYLGKNIFGGYAANKQDLAIFEQISALRTGDIAEKDNQGFYYITGRLKRFAKIFGNRTNLDEVESILKNQFIGQTFVVWAENDEKLLIGLLGNNVTEADIKFFLKDKLQIHPSVIKVILLTDIPLTSNGKVDYNAIKNG